MSKPVRLHKTTTNDNKPHINEWLEALILRHAPLLFVLAIVILLALFVTLCFAICGVSATESGVQYNQFNKII